MQTASDKRELVTEKQVCAADMASRMLGLERGGQETNANANSLITLANFSESLRLIRLGTQLGTLGKERGRGSLSSPELQFFVGSRGER